MRYSFDNIAAFLQVVETGSISAAAVRFNLAKSVVSKRLADLEKQLGVDLLHRSTRGVAPTDKGVAFHKRARDIIQQLDVAADEINDQGGDLCGQLRITVPMSFGTLCLGPLLFPLLSKHPRLEVAVNYDDRFVDLAGEGYDLAVRIGRLHDSSLVARKLALSRRMVCCSPDYARHAGLPATFEEIPNHTCIGYANVHSSQIWQFEPDRLAIHRSDGVHLHRLVIDDDERGVFGREELIGGGIANRLAGHEFLQRCGCVSAMGMRSQVSCGGLDAVSCAERQYAAA